MVEAPQYYRVRMDVINDLMIELDNDNPNRVLLRNGVFPEKVDERYLIEEYRSITDYPNNPLEFHELCQFNTWFEMHPEKVAGKEVITSSREFPITIKGTKEDIIKTIKPQSKDFAFELQLKKRRAKAKLKLLNL